MTLEELSEELGITPNYLKNQWQAIKWTKEKRGIYIYKNGRGRNARYAIRYKGEERPRWEPLNKGK